MRIKYIDTDFRRTNREEEIKTGIEYMYSIPVLFSSSYLLLGGSASALLTKQQIRRRKQTGNSFRDDSGSKLRDKEQQRLSSK